MRFEVLGPVRAVHGGQVLGPISELRRRLLAVLLARANRSVAAGVLAEALWGSVTPQRLGNSLSIHVHRLRQVLDSPGRLLGVPGGYLLEVGPEELDATVFGRLHADARAAVGAGDAEQAATRFREALQLWRGTPYADVDEGGVVAPETKLLAEARLVAYEELFDVELGLGRAREVVPELNELVQEYPLRERFIGQQMLALYRSGRRPRAEVAYRAARQRLARELKTGPGRELRELYEAICSEDPKLDHRHPPRRPGQPRETAAVPVRPGQLPPAAGAFLGREPELAELERVAALEGDGELILLTGMAGIGKTALAVRYAHGVSDQFDGGQLYLDLRGHSPGPALDPLAALGQLLRGLGADPNRAWESVADATAEYRSVVKGRRLLVLLDNAASADQVRPLLPATPGCLTLVTSRNRLPGLIAGEGAHRVVVGELPSDATRALLERLIGAHRIAKEPDQAAALVKACAGLPLALRIAAAQLADEPYRALADYLTEFEERGLATFALAGDERSAVATAFDLSYERLDSDTRRLFRLLGLVPGLDFTVDAAAALGGTTGGEAREAVRKLTGAHLLAEHAAGRYRFHDLLRGYARQRAETEESGPTRREALDRLFTWHYQAKEAAARLLRYNRREPPQPVLADGIAPVTFAEGREAVAWLREEYPNLAAAARSAPATGLPAWAWHLALGIGVDASRVGFLSEARSMLQDAVDAARLAGERHATAHALTELLAVHTIAGLPVTDELVAEAIGHAQAAGDLAVEGYCLYTAGVARTRYVAGVARTREGERDAAEDYLMRSLRILRQAGDVGGQSLTLNYLGILAYLAGDLRPAVRWWEELLHLRDEGSVSAYVNLSYARRMLGELDGIDELLSHAEALNAKQGNQASACSLLISRVQGHRYAGRFEEGLAVATAAQRLAEDVGVPRHQSDASIELGFCNLGLGQVSAARAAFEEAGVVAAAAGLREDRSTALRGLAEVELAAGAPALAEAYAREAIEAAWAWNRLHIAEASVTLGRALLALGRPHDAIVHGADALAIHEDTGHVLERARAHHVLGEAHSSLGEEARAEHLREALRLFETYGSPEAAEVEALLTAR